MAVLGSVGLAFLIVLPGAVRARTTFVPPVAFFAVTAIGTIGLYIAYVAPVYLRWRAGDSFEPRSWTLGPRYKWINAIAVVFVILMFIILMPALLQHRRAVGVRLRLELLQLHAAGRRGCPARARASPGSWA